MPTIKSSADLRNNYNEISTFCHNYPEPVFITKNGKGDLAVMSIEAYEEMTSRFELYSQLKEGMDDIATGNTRPFSEDAVTEQIGSLADLPQKFRLVDDPVLASWGIRFVIINNYLAFYIIDEEKQTVIIVRFLYQKSNWTSILRQGFSLI